MLIIYSHIEGNISPYNIMLLFRPLGVLEEIFFAVCLTLASVATFGQNSYVCIHIMCIYVCIYRYIYMYILLHLKHELENMLLYVPGIIYYYCYFSQENTFVIVEKYILLRNILDTPRNCPDASRTVRRCPELQDSAQNCQTFPELPEAAENTFSAKENKLIAWNLNRSLGPSKVSVVHQKSYFPSKVFPQ